MKPTTILVVEDEKIIAKGIEKRLRGLGYAVAALASTGEEAIQKATELRPDLVLMDIHLGPGMDGVEAAGEIRKHLKVPVVYLTAHSDEATLQRAKLSEPFGFVVKPYEDTNLHSAIEIGLYKHEMERRLWENEQWLTSTLVSIGDGVIATDEAGRVRFMNPRAEQLTGWTQADTRGKYVVEILTVVEDKSRQPIPNPVLAALDRGENVNLPQDTILIDKAGAEYPVDDSAAPIRDVNGKTCGAVIVFRDITQRCRLEAQLREAQKMEAIGRLAGGIAHDFNNQLTVINGYSDLLLECPPNAELREEYLRQINMAGKRAAKLTQQILAFSRKQTLMPCVLSLNNILRDMSGMIRRVIGEQIEFVTEPAPDLGLVKADPTQMGQVILNLAVNAADAMPAGGKLIIATVNTQIDEPSSRDHPEVKPGRYAMLSVTDTGYGMSEYVLAHVFEPFFTTKDVGEGTGLGLASVFGIVNQSGGHIEVTSKVGVGTTFRAYLPLVEEPKARATRLESPQKFKGNETILLVEDEEAVRHLASMVLQQCGYKVLEAANGQEALTLSDNFDGPIELLITDLVMPQLCGRELAERVAVTRPSIRVVFVSGYTEDRIVQLGLNSATADFLHKPFNLDELSRKVRKVLDRR